MCIRDRVQADWGQGASADGSGDHEDFAAELGKAEGDAESAEPGEDEVEFGAPEHGAAEAITEGTNFFFVAPKPKCAAAPKSLQPVPDIAAALQPLHDQVAALASSMGAAAAHEIEEPVPAMSITDDAKAAGIKMFGIVVCVRVLVCACVRARVRGLRVCACVCLCVVVVVCVCVWWRCVCVLSLIHI